MLALALAAQEFSLSVEAVEHYDAQNSPEAKQARLREVEDNEDYQELKAGLSGSIGMEFVNEIITEVADPAARKSYAEAKVTKESSISTVMDLVFGYEAHMETNLRPVFDNDDAEVLPAAWTATWGKLREILHPMGGTVLADIADFFDGLIEAKYSGSFDHTERLRGPEVSADISARTFYEVMEEHLSRAIMKRGDDGWSV